ncbi:hypothetical protein D9Q98_007441 [Chlorella vulgaris]|uniref:Uncharacterized protein n=1 Tax=Chlorella vulgaris TaxID=3077 RepID=A0A9D4TL92_CHLVU|nr:hypothetical protein D9Q98_007441 [Chlorella vulgaris]
MLRAPEQALGAAGVGAAGVGAAGHTQVGAAPAAQQAAKPHAPAAVAVFQGAAAQQQALPPAVGRGQQLPTSVRPDTRAAQQAASQHPHAAAWNWQRQQLAGAMTAQLGAAALLPKHAAAAPAQCDEAFEAAQMVRAAACPARQVGAGTARQPAD